MFGYENWLVFPIYVFDEKFEDSMDMLLLIDEDRFNRFMFHKTKNKNKKWFCKSCLQCFRSESVLIKHEQDCLSIIGVQCVIVEERTTEFENYFKQIPVPLKNYADFECNLENTKVY